MPFSVLILLLIVAAAVIFFVGGWLRVDLVGLLVLSALALTGLVSSREALAGFSSPAVVTVWSMFILSAGLTRTGIAHRLGQPLQRFAKGSEAVLVAGSASFASPLSHPAHLLVMGPGGYRFTDYLKIGVPVTIIAMLVAVWLLPILFPP